MKRPLACILGWNNWIMDLSDFTEYQSNNRRNKCKSSSAGAGCWILNTISPGPTQKMCNLCSRQVDERVSDVTGLVLISRQCLNIGVGGMFTRGPRSRSQSRDNSAPAPISSGSQQRSSNQVLRVPQPAWALSVCQHRNYYPHPHLLPDL